MMLYLYVTELLTHVFFYKKNNFNEMGQLGDIQFIWVCDILKIYEYYVDTYIRYKQLYSLSNTI